ncbi:DUF1360 domain-containing protein [Bacillus sp. FJAT-49736]|uniref:DUF1360 domain-containing protein n=1 Tax=Bacillus sp. FJAT-49736 TaxID=2833582 RepID=UPI001BC93961|nr:DUF1360 domain-containing protein [Bacillus sp. FJAT-49736]
MIHSWLLLILFSLAAFRLTRLIVYDRITDFIRRPFHEEMEETDEDGTTVTYIKMKGSGLRAWIGELLSCYWCTGIWCSAFIYLLWFISPSIAEPLIILLAIAGLAGILETVVSKWIN